MKFAKKFMVVPYIKLQDDPNNTYLSNLDTEIGDILINEKLPVDSKIKLYNIALHKFQKKYNPISESAENLSLNKINQQLKSFVDQLNTTKENDDYVYNQKYNFNEDNLSYLPYLPEFKENYEDTYNEFQQSYVNGKSPNNNDNVDFLNTETKMPTSQLKTPKYPEELKKKNTRNNPDKSPLLQGLSFNEKNKNIKRNRLEKYDILRNIEQDNQNINDKTTSSIPNTMSMIKNDKSFTKQYNITNSETNNKNKQKGDGLLKNSINKVDPRHKIQQWKSNKKGYFV